MPSASNKKLLILYVLQVLNEYSDENHPLMQEEISQKIFSLYGMESERKAIAANIQCLEDFGYDIQRVKNKGVYLGERKFEQSEITFLVDAIFSSRVINGKHSKELAMKLYSFLSNYQRKQFNYIYKADEIAKSNNKQIFLTIDLIHEAIEKGKKIEFQYNGFSRNKEITSKWRKVSPYFLLNSQGKYYLVCNIKNGWGIANYKVDRMSGMRITDEDAIDIKQIKGYEKGIDIAKYANENIYAFGGKSVKAKLWLYNDKLINSVYEWFDKDTKIYEDGDKLIAEVNANENAIVYWALQYGENVQLLEPIEVRERIKEIVSKMSERYN